MEMYELEKVMAASFVILVVLGWKLATGEWSTAAAFGSLFVAFLGWATSRFQVNGYQGGKKIKDD